MAKTWKSIISLLLILVFVFQLMPVSILATNANGEEAETESATEESSENAGDEIDLPEEESKESYVVGEVDDLREESAKHFRMSDGTFLAVEYGYPIHFKTSENSWADIDNTLTKSGDKYVSTNGDMVKSFPDSLESGKLFEMQYKDYHIAMGLISEEAKDSGQEQNEEQAAKSADEVTQHEGSETYESNADETAEPEQEDDSSKAEEVSPTESPAVETRTPTETEQGEDEYPQIQEAAIRAEVKNPSPTKKVTGESSKEEMVALDKFKSSVRFDNAFSDTDLIYENVGYDLKESIVIHEQRSTYKYSFALALSNLLPVVGKDGSILLKNNNGEEIFIIPSPYMFDANGSTSDLVSYELSKTPTGLVLSVVADTDWINSDSRVFPITIDPTVKVKNNGTIQTSYIKENEANSPGSNIEMLCGYNTSLGKCEIVVQFTSLPAIPANCVPVGSQIELKQAAYYYSSSIGGYAPSGNIIIEAHAINGTIGSASNSTWNTIYSPGSPGYIDNNILDYNEIGSSTIGQGIAWDISQAAIPWLYNNSSNVGIILKAPGAQAAQRNSNFYGSHMTDLGPALYVQYINTVGIEGYYSYHQASAGDAGNIYISDFTHNMTLEREDVFLDIAPMNVSISHYYNSSLAKCQFNSNTEYGINTANFNDMNVGKGWKLSVQQTAIEKTIGDLNYIIYTDGDGTEHYFYNTGYTTYRDEDGLGLTIVKNGNTLTMTDKDEHNTWVFYNGYLIEQRDDNGNRIYIAYDYNYSQNNSNWKPEAGVSNRIVQVVEHTDAVSGPQNDIVVASFYYEGNLLSRIVDYANRQTSFSYDNQNQLTVVTRPDGKTIIYHYESGNNRLKKAFDGESLCGIELTYHSNPKDGVDQVSEYCYDPDEYCNIYGNAFQMERVTNQLTSVRYFGADHNYSSDPSGDDLVEYSVFDYYGRNITTYTTTPESSRILGVAAGAYTENSSNTPSKNNHLSRASNSGTHAVNLLRESGFEGIATGNMGEIWYNWGALKSSNNNSIARAEVVETFGSGQNAISPHTGNKQACTYLNSTNGYSRVGQFLSLANGVTYTLSAYINTSAITSFDENTDHGVFLMFVKHNLGSETVLAKSDVIRYRTNKDIEHGWERISVTYASNDSIDCTVYLCQEGASGSVLFDDVQLEANDTVSKFNLIKNGDFSHPHDNNYYWNLSTNTEIGSQPDEINASPRRELLAVLHGDPACNVRVSQTEPINLPWNTTFLLSGWGKAQSVHFDTKSSDSDYDRFFGLIAIVHYTSSADETFYIPFCSMYNDWQYASGVIASKTVKSDEKITSIDVIAAYDKNANTAYIDDISLIIEPAQTYFYDDKGDPIAITSDDAKSAYEYYPGTSKIHYYTSPGGAEYTLEYKDNNSSNDIERVTMDHVTNYTNYNATGGPVSTTTSSTTGESNDYLRSANTYDAAQNHVTSSTNTNAVTTTYEYDTGHNIRKTQTGGTNQPEQDFLYSLSNNRLAQTFISGVAAIINGYDEKGNLSTLTRTSFAPDNSKFWQRYTMSYDRFGNRTSVGVVSTDTENGFGNSVLLAQFEYETAVNNYSVNNGRLKRMTYPNGDSVSYDYDYLFDRLISETYNSGTTNTTYHYQYDSEGSLAKKYTTTAGGTTSETQLYDYDSLGRLIHSKKLDDNDNVAIRTARSYDTSNRIKKQAWAINSSTSLSQTYNYNSTNETISSIFIEAKSMGSQLNPTVEYSYTPLMQLRSKTTKINNVEVFHRAYAYKGGPETNQKTSLVEYMNYRHSNDSLILGYKYLYDTLGRITAVYPSTDSGTSSVADQIYSYDDLGQLIEVTDKTDGTHQYTYSYDTGGNIRSLSDRKTVYKQINFGGHIINLPTYQTTTTELSYNDSYWKDRLTSVKVGNTMENIVYESATNGFISGNPISYFNGRHYNFTWQNGRQLATASVDGTNITYAYDMDGVRSSKTVAGTTYSYDTLNGKIVRQKWGSNTLVFIYDDVNQPYALIYYDGTNEPTKYYYALNTQGDVVALLFSTGNVAVRYRYNPWGEVTISEDNSTTQIGSLNPLLYRGYYYDSETALYYLQSRYYDPAIGRFINADILPTTDIDGFLNYNMFAYCKNDPVNHSDPTGYFGIISAIVVGGIIGGVTGAVTTWLSGGDSIEIITAAIAGMASGMAAATGPLGLLIGAVINAYATFEIDLHAQRRANPASSVNYHRAALKSGVSGISTIFTGGYAGRLVELIPTSEVGYAAYTAANSFFNLMNVAVTLPICSYIDSRLNPIITNTRSCGGAIKPHYNNCPLNAGLV